MDEPGHPVASIVVAVGILLAGVVAIVLVGRHVEPVLTPPDRVGSLQRTTSEEVSTPDNLLATYTDGTHIAVVGASRSAAPSTAPTCTTNPEAAVTECRWASEGLAYALVSNSTDVDATVALAAQAQEAVQAING